MIELLTTDLWRQLKDQAKGTPYRSFVAVAFLGRDASSRLPLNKGSVLVINCDETTVRTGLTDPKEIARFLKSGVKVFNLGTLHAKVFVIGRRAFVGSSNVSHTSEGLDEAAILATDRRLVDSCREFVKSLAVEPISLKEAQRLVPLFGTARKPTFPKGIKRPRNVTQRHYDTWALRTVPDDNPDDDDEDADDKGMQDALRELTSDEYLVERTRWPVDGSRFASFVKKGDWIVKIHEESPRSVFLQPPERVVNIRRYKKGRRMMIHLERKKWLRDKAVSDVRATASDVAQYFRTVKSSKAFANEQIKAATFSLWRVEVQLH